MQKQSPGGKKGVLKNFAKLTGKHQYQVFSREVCEIFKNTFL